METNSATLIIRKLAGVDPIDKSGSRKTSMESKILTCYHRWCSFFLAATNVVAKLQDPSSVKIRWFVRSAPMLYHAEVAFDLLEWILCDNHDEICNIFCSRSFLKHGEGAAKNIDLILLWIKIGQDWPRVLYATTLMKSALLMK